MASTSPASARRTASVTASPAIFPACSGSRERGAGSGDCTSFLLPAPCGPIPRGSPSVTASRGRRLEPDVDVRGATQQVEMVLDGELLAERFADAILYFVEPQLAFGQAPHQLEHHEPRPP